MSDEYITKEQAKAVIKENWEVGWIAFNRNVFLDGIDSIPANDIPKIVHCKDCKYRWGTPRTYKDNDCIFTYGWCGSFKDDEYCSYGKEVDHE